MNDARKIAALSVVLKCNVYDSLFWQLYYVSQDLHDLKPPMKNALKKIRRVHLRPYVHPKFYIEDYNSLIPGFYIDGSLCHVFHDGIIYYIPIEWVKQLYCEGTDGWYLWYDEFCCRLNVCLRGEKRLMYQQDLCLRDLHVFREMC